MSGFTVIPECVWTYVPEWKTWEYRIGHARVVLGKRNSYCDRGHFDGKVFGVDDIDDADSFPRYYMDEARAKAELADWLHWRLKVTKK